MGSCEVIVLDTHTWIWWLSKPEKLGKKAARGIDKHTKLGLPAICVWEVAAKAQHGHIKLDRPYDVWIDEALAADDRLELLPLSPRVAVESARLLWSHRDPADRFIVATARIFEAQLATADGIIQDSGLVKCVWD